MNYEKKYLVYKAKYLALKKQLAGGRTYEEMPLKINIDDYANLPKNEQIFYDAYNRIVDTTQLDSKKYYFSKLTKAIVDRKIANLGEIEKKKLEIEKKKQRIINTPNIEITIAEYNSLPADRYGFEWIPITNDSYQHEIIAYVKGRTLIEKRAQAVELEKERSQIMTKSRITPDEYHKLTRDQRELYKPVDGLTFSELRSEWHDYINKVNPLIMK